MKKKSVVLVILCLVVLAISIPVFADTGYFNFEIALGEFNSSSNVTKSNSIQVAYGTITGSNLHSSDVVDFRVRKASDDSAATESRNIVGNNNFALSYIVTGYSGTSYYLNGYNNPATEYPGTLIIKGEWTP